MLTGRRYLLALTSEQTSRSEQFAAACRAVWNAGLEQRRAYRRRGAFIGYVEQARQMAEAKKDPYARWLADAPSHILQQALRDLEKACKTHGTWKVRWRSKNKTPPTFCVEDGVAEAAPNGLPPVGVDRGVAIAVATSDGELLDREFATTGELGRIKRLQRRLARSIRTHGRKRSSRRRDAVRAEIGRLCSRIRARRADFASQTAHRLTSSYGLVVVEDLKVKNMTASAGGTAEAPGHNVKQKAGLNRAILNKGWGGFLLALRHQARYQGTTVVAIDPAYTSQTCHGCGHIAWDNRKSQAVFQCVACGRRDHADVNAAKNILAAGLAVTGRGDLAIERSVKRQPSVKLAA